MCKSYTGYTSVTPTILLGVTAENRMVTGFDGFGYTVTLKFLILACLGIYYFITIFI